MGNHFNFKIKPDSSHCVDFFPYTAPTPCHSNGIVTKTGVTIMFLRQNDSPVTHQALERENIQEI